MNTRIEEPQAVASLDPAGVTPRKSVSPTNMRRSSRQRSWRTRVAGELPTLAPVVLLVVVFAYFSLKIGTQFYEKGNLASILGQSSILGVMACGLTVPLVVGTFDLSVGWHASFAGVLGATLAIKLGTTAGITLTVLVGAAVGALVGTVVAYLKVSSMIATLGSGAILVGLTTMLSTSPVFGVPDSYLWLGQHRVAGFPASALVMLGLALLMWVWTNQTPFGRGMHAIGGSREASRLAGLSITRTTIIVLATSGAFAALAGVMLSSTLGAGQAGQGDNLLLDAFTAAAIGTVTFRKGQYNIAGTVVAVLLLTTMVNGMTIVGWPAYWQSIVKGVILIGAVAMSKGVSEDR